MDTSLYLLKLLNNDRAQTGAAPLPRDATLNEWAQTHATWMAHHERLQHQCLQTLIQRGAPAATRTVGENIGYSRGGTDEIQLSGRVHNGWQGSLGHWKNMHRQSFHYVGFGWAWARSGRFYVVQVFGGI